ncbi:MAG: DDE-type integrase/transposase/recombinase [Nitrosopumilaceae archaeon]|nr:IS1/IS6 family transposase [Nitrosopumilaceae archaeon]NIU02354.1 IS1/IS6 family transposase [Nitrosopumilaceae archaeon]NIU88811.1 DDE-type integrase/transposase/recombinase [Nitrosopumilaceae archaeon]NIV66936.1 DDE-type integrase/transposase/recombinase [Nitrosopumilaceae archaeon]NIX62955.1 DDE-type integrase/transposase/recombinase [Nitrosopumilaceae archaeon]
MVKLKDGWFCPCPDHRFRRVCCKHIHAVEISLRLREEVKKQNQVTINEIDISQCRFCHSDNIKKFGKRKNKNYELQRYICQDCHKTFSFNIGFERMKHNPKAITTAMQLYFGGESLRNVTKSLKLLGVDVVHATVYNWIKKYTNLMQTYLDDIVPQVGDVWSADEVYVKVKGNLKYVFSLMDEDTRFWIAQEVANRKEGHDARGLFQKGKQVTKTKPRVLITDGLKSYQRAYYKEFWQHRLEGRTKHLKNVALRGERNNNRMERLNGEFRDREKVVRGIKKDESPLISGYQIYHNYIRPHMSLDGKTPSEKCGISINGENKWITLIQNASKK